MPPPTPEHIRAAIQHEMDLGYSDDAILAGGHEVSARTVRRMRQNYRRYGLVHVPSTDPGGRPVSLTAFHQTALLEYLQQRPTAYIDEMAYFLLDEFGLSVGEATIYRTLRRLRWSRKIGRKVAAQRNEELRSRWLVTKLPQWRANQLVFLDESAACERTGMWRVFSI